MDAGNLLKPLLARGELHCIGATTLDEYRKHVEKDAALERRFQPVFVGEPTVEDTISILRGLKERYEVHHGVRIKDAALVSAAVLSNRYIADRFLPDKAIDLMDESAAKLRTEIDSMPTELDEISRRVMQLEIEREALKKESDRASKDRLDKLEHELGNLKADADAMRARWQAEKQAVQQVQSGPRADRAGEGRHRACAARRRLHPRRRTPVRHAAGVGKAARGRGSGVGARPRQQAHQGGGRRGRDRRRGEPLDRRAGVPS